MQFYELVKGENGQDQKYNNCKGTVCITIWWNTTNYIAIDVTNPALFWR
jgi:hypothetical protein